jgi:signal transduction histidine kinase
MARFHDLSIGQKLQRAGMLASLTALLAATLSYVLYDVYTFRRLLVERIVTHAQIVGLNCVSPLIFDDAETARSTLAALKAEPQVLGAAVLKPSGEVFADYRRDDRAADAALTPSAPPGPRFTAGALVVTHPILFEDRSIGTVVIRADLSVIRSHVASYLLIAALVLAGSLFAASVISRRVHEGIARPIRHLAETAQIVSTQKDYTRRAVAESNDETGTLIRTFNEMLEQIEQQNRLLEDARGQLERRVEERTRELAHRSEELMAANKELEAFSYSVSHDLRAPLRSIDGFSKALLEEYDGKVLDEQGNHYLKRVRVNTQRMSELIDDLLNLSRLGRAELVKKNVDLSGVAHKVAAELGGRDAERRVAFHIAPDLAVEGDSHLLRIVLENLMGNAWKFTARQAEARIEVGRQVDGADAPFFVRDNGAGFDMRYVDKLFGVFQRLHSNKDFEGTGIGLATVQRIIARHGGRIWAEGAVGQGASFYFTLGGGHT